MATITGIYCIQHRASGKRYVGQAVNIRDRWSKHKSGHKKGASAISDAIKVFGADAFDLHVLEECDRSALNEREVHWIAELSTLVPNGYNLNSGGKAPTFVSKETRQRQAAAKLGRKRDPSAVAKQRETFHSKVNTPEWRAKLSMAQMGRKHSAESNAKRGASQVGKLITPEQRITFARAHMRGRVIHCSNGETYLSTKEAAVACGVHTDSVIRVCNGMYKQAKGFTFQYGEAA